MKYLTFYLLLPLATGPLLPRQVIPEEISVKLIVQLIRQLDHYWVKLNFHLVYHKPLLLIYLQRITPLAKLEDRRFLILYVLA